MRMGGRLAGPLYRLVHRMEARETGLGMVGWSDGFLVAKGVFTSSLVACRRHSRRANLSGCPFTAHFDAPPCLLPPLLLWSAKGKSFIQALCCRAGQRRIALGSQGLSSDRKALSTAAAQQIPHRSTRVRRSGMNTIHRFHDLSAKFSEAAAKGFAEVSAEVRTRHHSASAVPSTNLRCSGSACAAPRHVVERMIQFNTDTRLDPWQILYRRALPVINECPACGTFRLVSSRVFMPFTQRLVCDVVAGICWLKHRAVGEGSANCIRGISAGAGRTPH